FLRAEGALRGWEMKGTPRELYNDGIRSAFNSVGGYPDVEMYIEGMIPTEDFDWDKFEGGFGSAPYVNYRNQKYNCESLNRISIKWHEEDTNEQKLQRIITQKWIAVFPLSHVAWTEFRRTGYPKLLPIPDGLNKSNGKIDTDIQIRRLPYPEGEYNSNRMEVIKAVGMLKGEDNGGTRLWWDINKPNF
ncbi:MAG: SusD/RagB family nutrient-binding outer membrane lipoprotein, partial [Odoribacter sp.]